MDWESKQVDMAEDIAEIKAMLKQALDPKRECEAIKRLQKCVWAFYGGLVVLNVLIHLILR